MLWFMRKKFVGSYFVIHATDEIGFGIHQSSRWKKRLEHALDLQIAHRPNASATGVPNDLKGLNTLSPSETGPQ
jgi:hypothetical protein